MDKFKENNSEILAHTGMESYQALVSILKTLGPEVYFFQCRCNVISAEDQFFLILIKLRQNKEDEKLAKLFSITPAVAKNIFITWINFLYEKWKQINLSPESVEDLISPDYLSENDPESDKKLTKIISAPAVPDVIPEGIAQTYVILMSIENIKHVSKALSSL